MPHCHVRTNIKDSELKDGIELRIAKTIAETLGKPLERMIITITPGIRLLRNGTTDPACSLEIHSINVFDAERNPTYTPKLKNLLMEEFGLPEERCVIVYHDLDINFIG